MEKSNPRIAQQKAIQYLGKEAILYPAKNPNKKYRIYDPIKNKYIEFGDSNYEDFTKHQDPIRRQRYLARATKIKGRWRDNPYSPNNLSINILW